MNFILVELETVLVIFVCILLVLLSGATWGLQNITDPILMIKNLGLNAPLVYAQYDSDYSGDQDTSDYYGSDQDTSDDSGDQDTSDDSSGTAQVFTDNGTGTAITGIPTDDASLPEYTGNTYGAEILDPVPDGPCKDTSTSDATPVECEEPPLPQKCFTNDKGLMLCSNSQAQRAVFNHHHIKTCFESKSHPHCPSDYKKKGSGNHIHIIHIKKVYKYR